MTDDGLVQVLANFLVPPKVRGRVLSSLRKNLLAELLAPAPTVTPVTAPPSRRLHKLGAQTQRKRQRTEKITPSMSTTPPSSPLSSPLCSAPPPAPCARSARRKQLAAAPSKPRTTCTTCGVSMFETSAAVHARVCGTSIITTRRQKRQARQSDDGRPPALTVPPSETIAAIIAAEVETTAEITAAEVETTATETHARSNVVTGDGRRSPPPPPAPPLRPDARPAELCEAATSGLQPAQTSGDTGSQALAAAPPPPVSGPCPTKSLHLQAKPVFPNLVGTSEVFKCVVLSPHRVAQYLGVNPRGDNGRSALLEMWEAMDPETYFGFMELGKELAHRPSATIDVIAARARSASACPGQTPSDAFVARALSILSGKECPTVPAPQSRFVGAGVGPKPPSRFKGVLLESYVLRHATATGAVDVDHTSDAVTASYNLVTKDTQVVSEPGNTWRLSGRLDARVRVTQDVVEVKVRMGPSNVPRALSYVKSATTGVLRGSERIALAADVHVQDVLQVQTYMHMFGVRRCVLLQYFCGDHKLEKRVIEYDPAVWELEILPALKRFVRDVHAVLSHDVAHLEFKLRLVAQQHM